MTSNYEILKELALDLIWSWNHRTDQIWEKLDADLWHWTHNAWVILQTVSKEKLDQCLKDPEFCKLISTLAETKRKEFESPSWFEQHYSSSKLKSIAYFSMEYMLSEALPIYSGGLGNVAGDQLKSASDLGVPVTAIGLLYQQGYFRQALDKDGRQIALYPFNDPGQLPISEARKANGEWLRFQIPFPGSLVWVRVWEVNVGRCKLYLLDSNDPENLPIHRGITSELYGGGSELRIQQEIILGIGGWRLLEALNKVPTVCHLNEGHAAFAILERARSYMNTNHVPFETALAATRVGNLFTTHTAVSAGFDRFSPFLVEQYLGEYANTLGISITDLLALGRENRNNHEEPFNMAYLAVRGSGAVNGVSELHGKVSRRLFEPLFPRWPEEEIPIGYVTNGVHMPSWESAAADDLWSTSCGRSRWLGDTANLEKELRAVPDEKLWNMRNVARKSLIEHSRVRLARQLAARGYPKDLVEWVKTAYNPNILTLGFARRFATYKRPNLLLQDRERLLRILSNPERPVQLVIAGKAHPEDELGKDLIQQWIQFIRLPEVRPHIIFLSDYDMLVTERLVRGVDVWINTPQRPWEACGTSGMKVLPNGGINFSELDGWWAEAFTPEVGWSIGDGKEHGNDPSWNAIEAASLYDKLENEIIPEFYDRDSRDIPTAWIRRMRESMATLTPQFSANRAVRQYTEQYYLPLAEKQSSRTPQQVLSWKEALQKNWPGISFGNVSVNTQGGQHEFEVQIDLNGLDPRSVRVELFASGPFIQTMTHDHNNIYRASVPANRPADSYTPRIMPLYEGVSVPLEEDLILWQK